MKLNHINRAKTGRRPIAFSLLAAIACSIVMLTASESFSSSQLPKKPLKCVDVSARWQLCGSGSKTHFTAGVGIRFNKLDPNGKIVASQVYEDCSKLAADETLPSYIRKKALGQCKKNFHVTDKKAVR